MFLSSRSYGITLYFQCLTFKCRRNLKRFSAVLPGLFGLSSANWFTRSENCVLCKSPQFELLPLSAKRTLWILPLNLPADFPRVNVSFAGLMRYFSSAEISGIPLSLKYLFFSGSNQLGIWVKCVKRLNIKNIVLQCRFVLV